MKLFIKKKKWLIAVVVGALLAPALWSIERSYAESVKDTVERLETEITRLVFELVDLQQKIEKEIDTLEKAKRDRSFAPYLNRVHIVMGHDIYEKPPPKVENPHEEFWKEFEERLKGIREKWKEMKELQARLEKTHRELEAARVVLASGGGCFHPETKVLMADGSLKEISRVREGDFVKSYNVKKGVAEAKKVLKTYTFPTEAYYVINGSLKVTAAHPFLMAGPKEVWKKAQELDAGDRVKSVEGEVAIRTIEKVKGHGTTHNFRVSTNEAYIVSEGEGLYVVHNGL